MREAAAMRAIVAAGDACDADYAATIPIRPRGSTTAAMETHDAALAYEARFVADGSRFITIEHAQHSWIRDAINVADDSLAAPACTRHTGKPADIVEPAGRDCGTDIPRRAAQPG